MRHTLPALIAATAVLVSATAQADWVDLKATHQDDLLFSVGRSPDGMIWVGGMNLGTGSGGLPTLATVLKRSLDGGQTWLDSSAGLSSGMFDAAPIMDLHMLSQWSGWVLLGDAIAVQIKLGQWKKVELDRTAAAFHMFDLSRGVAVGKQGGVWRTEDGGATWDVVIPGDGTDIDFTTLQCFADGRCFAAGQVTETNDTESATVTRYKAWEVWTSTGYGKNWTRGATETPSADNGQFAGPIWFLEDGLTGWLALSDWDAENERTSRVHLLKTTDGGQQFSDMDLPTKVGTMKNLGFKYDLHFGLISAMYWADAKRGRLVGATYLADEGSSGGGTPPPIYRRTDFVTTDGGKTWTKPDLGDIERDITTNPPGDPRPFAALFDSWVRGLAVGEDGMVQAWQLDCDRDSVCDATGAKEFICDRETFVCVPNPDLPAEDACAACGDVATDRDAVSPEDVAGTDVIASGDLRIPSDGGDSGGGCTAGRTPGSRAALPLLLLTCAILFARRRFLRGA